MPVTAATARVFTFAPKSESGTPITDEHVATAVAQAFPPTSKYGALRVVRQDYESTTLTVAGVSHGRVLCEDLAGVKATAHGTRVRVEYLRGSQCQTGGTMISLTTALTINTVPAAVGRYTVSASPVSKGRELGFLSTSLDTGPNIAADVAETLARLDPRIRLEHNVVDEFEVGFAPAAVFANFERILGRTRALQTGPTAQSDVREGSFQAPKSPSVTNSIVVPVFPYRTQSKVRVSCVVPYELRSDGSSTFPRENVNAMTQALRKIASD